MSILEKEVCVGLNHMNINYYKDLGYIIPKVIKNGKAVLPKGTKISVKTKDLQYGSGIRVTKICDICHKESPQSYQLIIRGREKSEDGLDKCLECSSRLQGYKKGLTNKEDCIAITNPELIKLFWNEDDAYRYKSQSGRSADFKCPDCGEKIKNKRIQSITNQGLFCYFCTDHISYPEKFMLSILKQLGVDFEYQKMFDGWFKKSEKKFFDFFLTNKNIIIETHGLQHYESGFETYGEGAKDLSKQIENDLYKKNTALSKGIKSDDYIVIDCRKSNLEFIRNSIVTSRLSTLFDLTVIDWGKANEFATNSLVRVVCELWVSGNRIIEIAKELKIDRQTVRKYLKQGSKIYHWCNYNSMESKGNRVIVQLSKHFEIIAKWESLSNASRMLGFTRWAITASCEDGKLRNNYRWMYLEDYEKQYGKIDE